MLQDLIRCILEGWPAKISQVSPKLQPYFHIRDELVCDSEVIFKGRRCVVPSTLKETVMERIHLAHSGVVACLRRARESVYWPSMTSYIKDYVNRCETCNRCRVKGQSSEPFLQHDRPPLPWAKVGVDLFELNGHSFLVTCDYWSNYIELDELRSTSAGAIVKCLKRHFATHGIPQELVSDNGPQFVAAEFEQFAQQWMFRHVTVSPYHHQSNGLIESSVKTAKTLIRKALDEGIDVWMALLAQRNTPSEGFTTSPVQRLMSRRTRDLMPLTEQLLRPSVTLDADKESRAKRQEKMSKDTRRQRSLPPLAVGASVWMSPSGSNNRSWTPAKVIECCVQPRSYKVETTDGLVYRRNRKDLKLVTQNSGETTDDESEEEQSRDDSDDEEERKDSKGGACGGESADGSQQESGPKLRRSGRLRTAPAKFKDYYC